MISLRLKFLKADEGLLRDKIACYDHFMSYMSWYYKHKHKMILIFAIFFRFFENFCHFLSFLALVVTKPHLGFNKGLDDRLLHSF